jgi:hypothetical protein
MDLFGMEPTAIISECGKYRYQLGRRWTLIDRPLYFVMLNPSTADASVDDPTIRKCIGFAKANNFGAIEVFNLFAWRATNPKELVEKRGFADVVGPENDSYLAGIPSWATVVCAWGSFINSQPSLHYRGREVKRMLTGRKLMCVKRTEDRPWHPLYVKYGPLEDF